MDNSIDKIAANYLFRDVVANTITSEHLSIGDTIVVTLDVTDKIGVVAKIFPDNSILLKTASGLETLKSSSLEFMHMIRKADNKDSIEHLKLRNHTDYERDLKDMTKEKHQHDGRPEHSPEIDKATGIPRSKICLNLKKVAAGALTEEEKGILAESIKYVLDAQYPLMQAAEGPLHDFFRALSDIRFKMNTLMNASPEDVNTVPEQDTSGGLE